MSSMVEGGQDRTAVSGAKKTHCRWSPWWLRPEIVVTAGGALALAPALAVSAQDLRIRFAVESYIGWSIILLVLIAVLAALTGVAAAVIGSANTLRPFTFHDIQKPSRRLTQIVALAFALWLLIASTRGLALSGVVAALSGERGASNVNREAMQTVPLLSLILHQAPIAAALNGAGIALASRSEASQPKRQLHLLLAVGICWSFLNSERLALFSVLIAAFIAYVLVRLFHPEAQRFSAGSRIRLTTLPLVVPILLIALFAMFEVSRSWTARASQESGILSYSTERVVGYYATATNNAARLVANEAPLIQIPRVPTPSFGVLDNAPFTFLLPSSDSDAPSFGQLLETDLNPEFNNAGGFTAPILAFGVIGAVVVWLMVGFGTGRFFLRARAGDLLGVLLYPIFIIAVIEAPRFFLFGSIRGLAPIAGALATIRIVAVHRGRSGPT